MDAKLNDLDRHRMEQSNLRSSEVDRNEGVSQRKFQAFDVGWHAVRPSSHLPFHGNPLDRSGTQAWAKMHLPVVLKTRKSTQFLPVNGRSAFGLKERDERSRLETFTLFWLSSDDFSKFKNRFFPEASTHLLGKIGKEGWRFVANLNDSADNVLVQLKKIQPQLCAVDVREMTLMATREDLAIAGQAVALVRWHQMYQFCPQCGNPTVPAVLGTARRCTRDDDHQLLRPQVTPVAVMLLQSPDSQQVLLARSRGMRPHMINCLSTRLNVCEGVEEAVQRASMALVGLEVSDVTVQEAQPWAAGLESASELLIGVVATVKHTELSPESSEVEEAHWFSKDALLMLLKGSAVPGHPLQTGFMDQDAQFFLPPPVTISHALLKYWVELS